MIWAHAVHTRPHLPVFLLALDREESLVHFFCRPPTWLHQCLIDAFTMLPSPSQPVSRIMNPITCCIQSSSKWHAALLELIGTLRRLYVRPVCQISVHTLLSLLNLSRICIYFNFVFSVSPALNHKRKLKLQRAKRT